MALPARAIVALALLIGAAAGQATVAPFDVNATFVNCTCEIASTTTAPPPEDVAGLLRSLKIALICVLGFGHLLASLLPWAVARSPLRPKSVALAVELACAGAAGVILGAAFSHLLPDSIDGFSGYFEAADPGYAHADYPFGPLVAAGALVALLWADRALMPALTRGAGLGVGADHHGGVQEPEAACGCPPGECCCGPEPRAVGRAYLYFAALTAHGVFEGLALGAAEALETFVGLLIAVTAHKLLDGFSLGAVVCKAKFSFLHSFLLLAICAAMTPLGIGVGWALASAWQGAGAALTQGIVFGLTCGCFFYVCLVELAPSALASGRCTLWKLALLTLGWAAMALVAVWA